ncbi:MAG: leucine--tRNA ligase [Planctomycetota bacterium]
MSGEYNPAAIREKWQAYWDQHKSFRALNPGDPSFDASKPKSYILDFFPYPSGAGLHVGHPEGYTATDILARYKRMKGFNVLHTMGWDAFGLPAEQHALETGQHPAITTTNNINTFRRQLKMLGFSYDWDRELSTTDTDYYKWTQWIFLQIFNSWFDETQKKARPIAELPIPADVKSRGDKAVREFVDAHRLAYLAEVPVNWCPALGTVLANEEVTNEGKSERGNHPVFKRPLKQWMLRITKYADRLADELEELHWPEAVKLMQRNWIGRSEGAQVRFQIAPSPSEGEGRGEGHDFIEVFTTRPDTLFGATYMVLAPEHPLVEKITTPDQRAAVQAYCHAAANRSELARAADAKEKTGVFTGGYAINPVNNEPIPIWVADYVLMGYGTGAIMAVPCGDQRDFEFATQFDLPIVVVVRPPDAWLANHNVTFDEYVANPGALSKGFVDDGVSINSGPITGLPTQEAKKKITVWLEERGLGRRTINYKIRDWLFSRQRYWGEPFPILHGPDGEIVALDESDVPLTLPEISDYHPTVTHEGDEEVPAPPLGRATEWATVTRNGKTYRRELNTMPQWAGSCWYYLRFCDPKNASRFVGKEAEQYWMQSKKKDGTHHVGGIDLYLGGAEHAVLHLLYARFWHKVLYDLGHVSTIEPFGRLFNQGMIRAFAYYDKRGVYVPSDEVTIGEPVTVPYVGGFDSQALQDAIKSGLTKQEIQDFVGTAKTSFYYQNEPVFQSVEKMSKSLKNVVNPEKVVNEYGADSLRLYEMFMGPLEASKPWNPRDVPGVFRFLQRVWRLLVDENTGSISTYIDNAPAGGPPDALERLLHKTIKKVGEDIERLAFNTGISAMMEFVNEAYRAKSIRMDQAERFVLVLSAFAPFITEELWQRLHGAAWKTSIAYEPWPVFDPALVEDDEVEIPIQVNGKLAGRLLVSKTAPQDAVQATALADPKVMEKLAGKPVVKAIYVPGRMLNLVVKG